MIKHLSLWNSSLRDELFDTGGRGRRGAESSTAGCKHSAQMPGCPSQAIIILVIDWSSDVLLLRAQVGTAWRELEWEWQIVGPLRCLVHNMFFNICILQMTNRFWGAQGSPRTAAQFRSCVSEIGYIQTEMEREIWFLFIWYATDNNLNLVNVQTRFCRTICHWDLALFTTLLFGCITYALFLVKRVQTDFHSRICKSG